MYISCEVYAALILIFVIGYASAWYRYNLPAVHIVVRKVEALPPLKTPIAVAGPGSERFHNQGDESDGGQHDHDNQVISRMRK